MTFRIGLVALLGGAFACSSETSSSPAPTGAESPAVAAPAPGGSASGGGAKVSFKLRRVQ